MHRKIHSLPGLAVLSAGILAGSAVSCGAILVQYDFGTTSEADLSPTTTGSGISSAAIVNASGLIKRSSGVTFAGSSGPRALGWEGVGNVSGTLSEALGANQYFTFSLSPAAGQKIDLTNITFFANTGATTGIARTFELQISTDGTNFNTLATSAILNNELSAAALFDISLGSYSNITGPATFRMAFYDAANDNAAWGSGNWIRLEDITVNGAVSPVPEPSAIFTASLGAIALLRRKR